MLQNLLLWQPLPNVPFLFPSPKSQVYSSLLPLPFSSLFQSRLPWPKLKEASPAPNTAPISWEMLDPVVLDPAGTLLLLLIRSRRCSDGDRQQSEILRQIFNPKREDARASAGLQQTCEEKKGRDVHAGQTVLTGVRWVSCPSLIEFQDLLMLLRQHCPEKGI